MVAPLAPSRLVLVLLLTVDVVSMVWSTSAPPLCTSEQETAFKAVQQIPLKCAVQSVQFEVCDDDCLAYQERVLAQAPNCSIGGGDSETERATHLLDQCKRYRLTTSSKYVPKESPGLRNCTFVEREAWEKTTGARTPLNGCAAGLTTAIGSSKYCSADCLKLIEDTITQAPQCVTEGQFSPGELVKDTLVACIKATTSDLQGNKVLQTVATADGKAASKSAATERRVGAWIVAALVAIGVHVGTA